MTDEPKVYDDVVQTWQESALLAGKTAFIHPDTIRAVGSDYLGRALKALVADGHRVIVIRDKKVEQPVG